MQCVKPPTKVECPGYYKLNTVTGTPDMPCTDVMVNNYQLEQLSDDQRKSLKGFKVTQRKLAYFEVQTRLSRRDKVVDRLKSTRYVRIDLLNIFSCYE